MYWIPTQTGPVQVEEPAIHLHHRSGVRRHKGWHRLPYLALLKLGVKEDPTSPHAAYYHGRELRFAGRCKEAVQELDRYLALPSATWKEQRAAALRHIAQCHLTLAQPHEAQRAAYLGVLEVGNQREGWLTLSDISGKLRHWHIAYWAATKALAIADSQPTCFGDSKAKIWRPHDTAAIAAFYAGFFDEALKHGKEAAALNPNDERLRTNMRFYQQAPRRERGFTALNSTSPGDGFSACRWGTR